MTTNLHTFGTGVPRSRAAARSEAAGGEVLLRLAARLLTTLRGVPPGSSEGRRAGVLGTAAPAARASSSFALVAGLRHHNPGGKASREHTDDADDPAVDAPLSNENSGGLSR